MIKKTLIFFLLLWGSLVANAENKYFSERWISIFNGSRNIYAENIVNTEQLDFLNYVYTQEEKADYNYFQIALRLRRNDRYKIDGSLSLYNNLMPYAYNVSFNYLLPRHFGIIAGSMSNRYYLTEFNDFYSSVIDKNIVTRYIIREWKFNMLSFYLGPTFSTRYNTIEFCGALKAGLTSFNTFNQRNIIKENLSNYKSVYDYQTTIHFSPFLMPELLINIDLLKYKKVILGGRFQFSYMVTRNSINYELSTYEWTYENVQKEKIKLPQHIFQQTDWDFGIYFRW